MGLGMTDQNTIAPRLPPLLSEKNGSVERTATSMPVAAGGSEWEAVRSKSIVCSWFSARQATKNNENPKPWRRWES